MNRSLIKLLLLSAAVSFVCMSIFQWGKHLVIPGITIWQSHQITNVFIALLSTLAVYVGFQIAERLKNAAIQELAERKRLEAKLDQVNQECEEQVRGQTSELTRLNFELEMEMAEHKRAKAILNINEERFRNMADNIQEGLTIIENGNVVYANQRACEIFGCYPQGEYQFISTQFAAPEERGHLTKVIEAATRSSDYPKELQYWTLRSDSTRRCVHDLYSFSQKDGITRSYIVTSDITERVQAYHLLEQAVEERTRELSTVLEVSQKVTSTLELEPLLRLILDQIQTVIPFIGAAIFTLESDVLTAVIYKAPNFPDLSTSLHLTLANSGLCEEVIRTRDVLVIDDVHGGSPLVRAFLESAKNGNPRAYSDNVRSWIGIPLVIKDRVIGLLSLTHSEPNYYSSRHVRLALTIANQVAVAMENARLYEQAYQLATLEERQRIARELHDSVTQLLYGMSLYSTAAIRAEQHKDYEQIGQYLSEIKSNALQALQEMRLLIFEMHPPVLNDQGLVTALQRSLEAVEARTGLQTELQVDGLKRLPAPMEGELFRIAMEALNNLVKYAKACNVTINLQSYDDIVYMEISDNGVGFDLNEVITCGGLGLRSMEERAKKMGGSLEISSILGVGTKVRVEVPVNGHKVKHVEMLASVKD